MSATKVDIPNAMLVFFLLV